MLMEVIGGVKGGLIDGLFDCFGAVTRLMFEQEELVSTLDRLIESWPRVQRGKGR